MDVTKFLARTFVNGRKEKEQYMFKTYTKLILYPSSQLSLYLSGR